MPDEVTSADARRMPRRAAMSGWVGSALEYYDFSIYAAAAALVFPQVFFPSESPAVALVASLATYGVGYVARPLGAFVLGNFGDKHGRKRVLVFAMMVMGRLDAAGRAPPDIPAGGRPCADPARRPAAHPGLRRRR